MSNTATWYLTQEGWLNSSNIDLVKMQKGRDIFQIITAGRNGFCDSSSVTWDSSACDAHLSSMENELIQKYGRRPADLAEWFNEYEGPTL